MAVHDPDRTVSWIAPSRSLFAEARRHMSMVEAALALLIRFRERRAARRYARELTPGLRAAYVNFYKPLLRAL